MNFRLPPIYEVFPEWFDKRGIGIGHFDEHGTIFHKGAIITLKTQNDETKDDILYPCTACGRKFNKKFNLKRHFRVHRI